MPTRVDLVAAELQVEAATRMAGREVPTVTNSCRAESMRAPLSDAEIVKVSRHLSDKREPAPRRPRICFSVPKASVVLHTAPFLPAKGGKRAGGQQLLVADQVGNHTRCGSDWRCLDCGANAPAVRHSRAQHSVRITSDDHDPLLAL